MLELIENTRKYLNYIELHYNNVLTIWEHIKSNRFKKIYNSHYFFFDFLNDEYKYKSLDNMVLKHDISKLSESEFVQYRKKFYPTIDETMMDKIAINKIDNIFEKAWSHHKDNNSHHYESWTETPNKYLLICDIVHRYIDWAAMSLVFGGTPMEYLNKQKIILPRHAVEVMDEIETCLLEMGVFELGNKHE